MCHVRDSCMEASHQWPSESSFFSPVLTFVPCAYQRAAGSIHHRLSSLVQQIQHSQKRQNSMNVVCNDFNMITNRMQLNAFQSSHSTESAVGITFSVSVKSLLPGTIKGGLGLLNPACQNSNGPFGSSVIHLSSVNSWQPCPSIDYQLRGRRRRTTGRPIVPSPEGGLPAK